MRSRFVLGIALASLIVPVLAAPAGAVSNSAAAQAKAAIAYWTPARIAAAKPRDLAPVGLPIPKAGKPGGGGGGGVTGASWTGTGPVFDKTGKVFFHMAGGDWQCSGSIVSDNRAGYSTVLTAGHCGIDETTGEFATNWIFMPNWDAKPASFSGACTDTLYGCWTTAGGGGLYVDNDFATAGSFNDQAVTHDWTFAVVRPGGLNGTTILDNLLGSYPIAFGNTNSGETLGAFGYPAAGKYHGNDLTYCSGPIFTDGSTSDLTWGMVCGMTGGSSGGPWFDNYNASSQTNWTLASLNSYGYSGVKNMYGPKFNGETQTTYNASNSGALQNTRT